MRIKLKPWDEVVELAKEYCVYSCNFNTERVLGITKDALPWGNYIESEPADKDGDYFVDGYWWVKEYMVESDKVGRVDDIE